MKYVSPLPVDELRAALQEDDADEVIDQVASYLDTAPVVVRGAGTFDHPSLNGPQPIGQASDGAWVWPVVLSNLLRAGVVGPEIDFVRHALAAGSPPTSLEGDVLEEAILVAQRGS